MSSAGEVLYMARVSGLMPVIEYRSGNDGLAEKVSADTACVNLEPSMTLQDAKDDADINVLVRRFGLTGVMPSARGVPEFGDFSQVVDYQSALNSVLEAQEAFDSLPADIRLRFGNDAGQLWEFVHDPKNWPEARELGLIEKEPVEPAPQKVEVVNQPVVPAVPAK